MPRIIIAHDDESQWPHPQTARNLQLLLSSQLSRLNGGNPFSKATIEVIKLVHLYSKIQGLRENPQDIFIVILSNNPDSRLLAAIPQAMRSRTAIVYTGSEEVFDTDPRESGYANVLQFDSDPKLGWQVIFCITDTSNAHVIVDKE